MLSKFNLTYLFILIIWPVLYYLFRIDGAGRIPIVMTLCVVVFNIRRRKNNFLRMLFSKPIAFWFCWVVFNLINTVFKGTNSDLPTFYFVANFFIPLVAMLVASTQYNYTPKSLIKCVFYALIIISIWGLTGMSISDAERITSDQLGNTYALMLTMLVFVTCLLYSNRFISLKSLFITVIAALFLIVMTATRKALGGTLIIILMTLFSEMDFRSPQKLISSIIVIGILLMVSSYIMNNTLIGERIENTNDVGNDFNTSDIELLNVLGDRAIMYINGWEIFVEHPLTGIGLMNYTKVADSDYVLHSEYIVQLAECGLVGFVLFSLFYISILKKIIAYKGNDKLVLLGCVLAILFICFTAWIYSFSYYFIILGIVIGIINRCYYCYK